MEVVRKFDYYTFQIFLEEGDWGPILDAWYSYFLEVNNNFLDKSFSKK